MALGDLSRTLDYVISGNEHPVYCQVCKEELTHKGGLRTVSDEDVDGLSGSAVCLGYSTPTCFQIFMGIANNDGYESPTLTFEYLSPEGLQAAIEKGEIDRFYRSENALERRVREFLLRIHRRFNVEHKDNLG